MLWPCSITWKKKGWVGKRFINVYVFSNASTLIKSEDIYIVFEQENCNDKLIPVCENIWYRLTGSRSRTSTKLLKKIKSADLFYNKLITEILVTQYFFLPPSYALCFAFLSINLYNSFYHRMQFSLHCASTHRHSVFEQGTLLMLLQVSVDFVTRKIFTREGNFTYAAT